MNRFVLDSSSIISLSDTCLFGLLNGLMKKKGIEFFIPKSVERESVERPLNIKKFELNALRIKQGIDSGVLQVFDKETELRDETLHLEHVFNSVFHSKGKDVTIMHRGEVESIVLLRKLNSKILVIDERITRLLLEDPFQLRNVLQRRQRRRIDIKPEMISEIRELISKFSIVRSSELVALAYENGLLNIGISSSVQSLEAALYAVKFNGCAISNVEILRYLREVRKRDFGKS